jgi:hypothetical protein
VKTLLIVLLALVLAAVFINDVGNYARAKYVLRDTTDAVVAEMATTSEQHLSRDQAALRAAEYCRQRGVKVYQYDQNGQGVEVWTEMSVTRTWVIGPYLAWQINQPLGTPFVLRDHGSSVFR